MYLRTIPWRRKGEWRQSCPPLLILTTQWKSGEGLAVRSRVLISSNFITAGLHSTFYLNYLPTPNSSLVNRRLCIRTLRTSKHKKRVVSDNKSSVIRNAAGLRTASSVCSTKVEDMDSACCPFNSDNLNSGVPRNKSLLNLDNYNWNVLWSLVKEGLKNKPTEEDNSFLSTCT